MGELDESRARLTSDYTKHNLVKSFLKELTYLKLRHYEKATKLEKNLLLVLTNKLFLLSSVKKGRFFQTFVSFSEAELYLHSLIYQGNILNMKLFFN